MDGRRGDLDHDVAGRRLGIRELLVPRGGVELVEDRGAHHP
jgi:hypothetical protein